MVALIDSVLDIARRGMARAIRELNDSQGLGRVPPELLGGVFSRLPLNGRIRASHVCHRWRAVSLETATLWSAFDASTLPPSLVKELFERSKDALLSLKLTRDVRVPEFTALLENNMYRMLDLEVTMNSTWRLSSSIFHEPAPRLRRLCAPRSIHTVSGEAENRTVTWPELQCLTIGVRDAE